MKISGKFKNPRDMISRLSLPNIFQYHPSINISFFSRLNENTYVFFVLLAIFLIPFDSFRFFPASSVYRPISVLVLLLPFVYLIFRGKLYNDDLVYFGIFLFIISQTLLFSIVLFGQYNHIPKAIITSTLMLIILLVFNHFFKSFQGRETELLDRLTNVIIISILFISMVGIVQILGKIGLFPRGLVKKITLLFSYRTVNRVQLVSGEPSMIVRNLITFFPFVWVYAKGSLKKVSTILIIVFLLASGSTYGYLTIIMGALAYFLLFQFRIKYILNGLIIIMIVMVSFFAIYEKVLDPYTVDKINKVAQVAQNPLVFQRIIAKDGSIFQRTINPVIGFMSGSYNYFLGVGLDNYRYIYPGYIKESFPFAINYRMVQLAVDGTGYITPKSLYAKVFSEFGLIPFLLLIGYLGHLYFRIREIPKDTDLFRFCSMVFAIVVVLIVNTDSIIYVNYYFLLLLLHFIVPKKKMIT